MTEPSTLDFEAWFTERYSYLQRLTAATARALGIRGDDAEDFASWATMRLWDNEYALLKKWRGDSSLETFVRVVVTTLGREYRVLQWGRWRPSAAALRLGRLAILLEQLVYRDGMRPHEAYERLRTRGEGGGKTDAELAALLGQLPVRPRSRHLGGGEAESLASVADDRTATDDVVVFDERDAQFREVLRALHSAVAMLPSLQRVLIELHVMRALKIADVARALGVEQKPLYRERDRALATLRQLLHDAGVEWDDVRELLDGDRPSPGKADDGDTRHTGNDRDDFGDDDTRDNGPPRPSHNS